MKSDRLIHEITADYGQEDPDRLRRRLKSLRTQIKNEIFYEFRKSETRIKDLY